MASEFYECLELWVCALAAFSRSSRPRDEMWAWCYLRLSWKEWIILLFQTSIHKLIFPIAVRGLIFLIWPPSRSFLVLLQTLCAPLNHSSCSFYPSLCKCKPDLKTASGTSPNIMFTCVIMKCWVERLLLHKHSRHLRGDICGLNKRATSVNKRHAKEW